MNQMVMRETADILPAFQKKMISSMEQIIRRFTKSIGLTHCAATHMVQEHFKETQVESSNFIAMMKGRLAWRKKDNIVNMDQTPIAYSFHARTTLEAKGMKTIQVRMSMTNTKCFTVALTVTASGKMLPPL